MCSIQTQRNVQVFALLSETRLALVWPVAFSFTRPPLPLVLKASGCLAALVLIVHVRVLFAKLANACGELTISETLLENLTLN